MDKNGTKKEIVRIAKKMEKLLWETYEPMKELNTDKCKRIAKSIRNLK